MKISRITASLITVVLAACNQSTSLSSGQEYAAVDKYSSSVYTDVAKMLHQDTFVKGVQQGVSMKPADFAKKFWGGGVDGDVKFGGNVYRNVLLAPSHSRYISRNLEFYAQHFGTMDDLFKFLHISKGTDVSAADVQMYYRFTADFLQAGGFTKHADAVVSKYSSAQIFAVMRVGVFISLMPQGLGGASASLGLTGGGQSNNIAGLGAAGIQLTGMVGKIDPNMSLAEAPSSGQSPFYLDGDSSSPSPTVPADKAEVTNRIPGNGQPGMNPGDATQCYNKHGQNNNGQVNNLPTAGVDNTTFGSADNGDVTSACGKCLNIAGTKPVLIADRIWENGGTQNKTPSKSGNAPKTGGKGYTQYDLDPKTFKSLYPSGGANPQISAATVGSCPSDYPKPGNSDSGGTSSNPMQGS